MMHNQPRYRSENGIALVIVLAFVVLLTIAILAFFSRATAGRQLSNSSFHQARVDELARSALDIITSDLKQEIVDGSDVKTFGDQKTYLPSITRNMVPTRNPAPASPNLMPTLLRTSSDTEIPAPGADHRASDVLSSAPAAGGRSISLARWNKHYLVPRDASATKDRDTTPISGFQAPKWVYVTDQGPEVLTVPNKSVIGRYAYAIYDEGALLDANVAGYPMSPTGVLPAISPHPSPDPKNLKWFGYSRKGAISFADLTAIGMSPGGVTDLVGWRNYASSQPLGSFSKFTYDAAGAARYYDSVVTNTNGFLKAATAIWTPVPESGPRTDQVLVSRQQLIDLQRALGFSVDALQYLGTFSRTSSAPSWSPTYNASDLGGDSAYAYKTAAANPSAVNRSFSTVRHKNADTIVTYNDDGSIGDSYPVKPNDPLVQTRFSLARLAWIGHNGPNTSDFPALTPSAIEKCFGLRWNSSPAHGHARWEYVHGRASNNDILSLDEVANANREPNFFELLKAGLLSGSLGGHPGSMAVSGSFEGPVGEHFDRFSDDKDRHIIQIGANIIDQADANNFPTAIYYRRELTSGLSSSETEFFDTLFGLENLPMIHKFAIIANGTEVTGTDPITGEVGLMVVHLVPEFWNPHAKLAVGNGTNDPEHPTPDTLRLVVYGACSIYNTLGDPTFASPEWEGDMNPVSFGYDYHSATKNDDAPNVIVFQNPRDGSTPRPFFDRPAVLTGKDSILPDPVINYEIPGRAPHPDNRYPAVALKKPTKPFPFLGFFLGKVKITEDYPDSVKDGYHISMITEPALTFVLEYYDGTKWLPYTSFSRIVNTQPDEISGKDFWIGRRGSWTSCNAHIDPRTGRFSASSAQHRTGANQFWVVNSSIRFHPGLSVNKGTEKDLDEGRNTINKFYPRKQGGIFNYQATSFPTLDEWMHNRSGLLGSNGLADPELPNSLYYYRDPDRIVRPGDGWRAKPIVNQADANSDLGDGMMTYHLNLEDDKLGIGGGNVATNPYPDIKVSDTRRRSIILNRPFRSVGELGYVFRDQPFKTLDFWSGRSGDGALLDLFSVRQETPLVSGKINPNNAPAKVLTALIAETLQGEGETTSNPGEAFLNPASEAETVAGEIFRRLHLPPSDSEYLEPLGNPADLTNLGNAIQSGFAASGSDGDTSGDRRNKRYAEAPVRALADVTQTRTWNLMIDVIAQAGVFPPGSNQLSGSFVVQGERRYWLHVAIDRFTGQVVDQSMEVVYE